MNTADTRRTIVLIAPSYGYDPKFSEEEGLHNYLIKCKLLPSVLDKELYTQAHDFTRMFSGDIVISLEGQVKADRVKDVLHMAVLETDVLIVLFMGHGTLPNEAGMDGTWCLSQRETLTTDDMLHCIRNFKGTFIEIVNTCFAGGLHPNAFGGGIEKSLSGLPLRDAPWIKIISSQDGKQSSKYGLAFQGAMRHLVEYPLLYSDLPCELEKNWSTIRETHGLSSMGHPIVQGAERYQGIFLHKASLLV